MQVLITADDAFLSSLPPHLAAEAALLRERAFHAAVSRAVPVLSPNFPPPGTRRQIAGPSGAGARNAVEEARVADAPPQLRQVLPQGSERSIVRLVEVASGMNKGLLHSVLAHLCAHSNTRPSTVRLLLAQALAPPGADMERARGGGADSDRSRGGGPQAAVVGLAKRALEALCHIVTQQASVAPLLLDRALLVSNEAPNPTPGALPSSGKGKGRADSKFASSASRHAEPGAASGQSTDKAEKSALDKMLARLSSPDVIKSSSTMDLIAQVLPLSNLELMLCDPAHFSEPRLCYSSSWSRWFRASLDLDLPSPKLHTKSRFLEKEPSGAWQWPLASLGAQIQVRSSFPVRSLCSLALFVIRFHRLRWVEFIFRLSSCLFGRTCAWLDYFVVTNDQATV